MARMGAPEGEEPTRSEAPHDTISRFERTDLTRTFGAFTAVDHITFDVQRR